MLLLATSMAVASEDHSHHSDDLLFLLQHKIAIGKLQAKLPNLENKEKTHNRQKQQKHFKKALPKLKRFMAVPESRYPNLDMYAQSLQSRGALLKDFTELLLVFHSQGE